MTEGTINIKGLVYATITPKKGKPFGMIRVNADLHAQGYFKTGEIYDGEFHPRKKKKKVSVEIHQSRSKKR